MEVTARIERFLFDARPWKLLVVVFLLCLVKTGIWTYPNPNALFAMAQDPFANPFTNPDEHYMMWSWLGVWVAWLIGATSLHSLFVYYLLLAVAFTCLFVRIAFATLPRELARTAIVLFAVLPVSTTAYFWVGQDALTLLLMMTALAFPAAPAVTLAAGVLLGMQHFEQGFFGAAALSLAVFLNRRQRQPLPHSLPYSLPYSLRFCLLFLLATVAGKLVLVGLFRHYGLHVNSGRMYWLRHHLDIVLWASVLHIQTILWSVLGLGWIVALRFLDWGRRSVPFFVALGGACLLALVSGDQTRVIAIVTFPLVTAYWLLNPEFLARIGRREVALLFALWVVVPVNWVWMGMAKWSVFPYDVVYVLHRAFGWFSLPERLSSWPFS